MQQINQNPRYQKAVVIAKTSRIKQEKPNTWKVPSQNGKGQYTVISNGFGASCTCPDHETRQCKCKHILAVELIVTKEIDNQGNTIITQTVRKTYKQDWKNYNLAQRNEKSMFMKMLSDITQRIPNTPYEFGRPTNTLADSIYAMVFKVYSGFSGRRFNSDLQQAKNQGMIEKAVPRSSMFDYFGKKEVTPILCDMVTLTSLPLKSIERNFAIDSTGFGTGQFQRWFSFKHGKEISSRKWVKCHFVTGVKTNIITSVKITSEFDNDCPQLKELVEKTAENFDMDSVSGDKAYLSRENLELIDSKGAKPLIPFKKNSKGSRNGSVWKKMYHYFMLNNEEFLQEYHQRSNVESSVHMIKSKFGDRVRSKNWTAQVNEALCKVICHNICCLIMEIHTLGINPEFDKCLVNFKKELLS